MPSDLVYRHCRIIEPELAQLCIPSIDMLSAIEFSAFYLTSTVGVVVLISFVYGDWDIFKKSSVGFALLLGSFWALSGFMGIKT